MAALKAILFLGLLLAVISSSPIAVDGGSDCPKASTFGRGSFPDGFLFGATTSAFQHEGAPEEGGRGLSIWDSFTHKHSEKNNNLDDRLGVDFYHHYKEDVQLLKKLNMDAFRFSISWSRIFPHGKKDKGVSEAGVKFYNDLINELIANGVTPVVTLFQWDVPQALEDEYGGFLSDRILEDFREFAKFAFNEYGDRVKHWVTINEPSEFSLGGYGTGEKAPGRCSKCVAGDSGREVYTVSHNLLLAHAEAVEEFRKCAKCRDGKIGIVQSPMWFEPYEKKSTSSEEIVKRAMDFTLGWHLEPITHGDYPQTMKDSVGDRLPSFTDEQKVKLKGSSDFVGVNYFTSAFVAHVEDVDQEKPSWEADSRFKLHLQNPDGYKIGSQPATAKYPVCADGLRKVLKYIKENYDDPEIIVTGNGYKETLGEKDALPDALSDSNRKYYHMRHLMALHGAVCEDKVNVKGYFVSSLMDGLEWEDGYKTRSGLYYVDYAHNLERHEKQSAKWLSKLLEKAPIQSKVDLESRKEL